jgi:hemoglobin
MKKEIETREDLVQLVDRFYDRVVLDDLLAPHFEYLDFVEHKPRMVAFWAFVLLGEAGYATNVFDKHRHLPIGKPHFDRWLALFIETVQEYFTGEQADAAINKARLLAWTFSEKMESLRPGN